MIRIPKRLLSLVLSCSCWIFAGTAVAQEFPTKPIRLVVANSPGTFPDTVGRLMATEMAKFLNQPIIVENKPGGDQVIGLEYVAKQAPPDGHTAVIIFPTALVTLPLLVKNLRFDPLSDLVPVISLVEGRLVLGSSSQAPWKTFDELVAHARANPGKLNYGSPSTGVRLSTEAVIRAPNLGLNVVHIPYNGAGPYYQALITKEVDMGIVTEGVAQSFGDKFRPLAVTGTSRLQSLPDVPTFAQLGHPQIRGFSFILSVRAGTPKAFRDKLYATASQALQQPEARVRISKLQMELFGDNTPETAAKSLAEEAQLYADVAKRIGIQPQ